MLNPHDGFRVVTRHTVDTKLLQLLLEFRLGGEHAMEATPVLTASDDEVGTGHVERMRPILTAVCRYLNTGGSSELLTDMFRKLEVSILHKYDLQLPDELVLLRLEESMDGGSQAIYRNTETGKYIVVEEDTYAEEMEADTLYGMLKEKPSEPDDVDS